MKRSGFKRLPGRVEKTCQQCGVIFSVHRCRVGTACSVKCARLLKRTRVTRICRNCSAEFAFAPSQLKHYKGGGKYCSRLCKAKGTIKETADKPIRDRYGRSNRTADKDWQLAVRERDDYTCQRCGKQEDHIHTHHVAPRSIRPDLIHDIDNGKCLCAHCHLWCHHHPIEARALGLLSNDPYERAKKERNSCSVCGDRCFGLGYCRMHYKRFKKYGDPLLTRTRGYVTGPPLRVSATHRDWGG